MFEFLEIIPRLTDPARFGGDPRDAFTVVVPSLPGYGLSFTPNQPRFDVPAMADCLFDLMHEVLGYERFGAQGGDSGAAIASRLAYARAHALIGIHVNLLSAVSRDPAAYPNPTDDERRYLDELAHWTLEEAGYASIQGSRPQSLAVGLTDSPAGLAAWIVEKFRAWSDCEGDIERAISRDRMLADIALYWFTGSITASFWPYYGRLHGAVILPPPATPSPSRPLTRRSRARSSGRRARPPSAGFTDLRRWTVMPRGGHFAALEQPDALAQEMVEILQAAEAGSRTPEAGPRTEWRMRRGRRPQVRPQRRWATARCTRRLEPALVQAGKRCRRRSPCGWRRPARPPSARRFIDSSNAVAAARHSARAAK